MGLADGAAWEAEHGFKVTKYQFKRSGVSPSSPLRDTWAEAAEDAVKAGAGKMIGHYEFKWFLNDCEIERVTQVEYPKQHEPAVPASSDQWDEKLRGKKMSSSAGKVIFKYQMPIKERFTMKLPAGAEILRVADQDGKFWLWAVVDTRKPDEDAEFIAVKCGANVPEGLHLKYLGHCAIFVQQELALYIFRVITEKRGHRTEVTK